jgi:hypothetical protein
MSDIALTDTYELQIESGDFAITDSEAQSIKLLFDTSKGDWTQSLLTGIGGVKWLKGRLDARFEREIQLQIQADTIQTLRVDVVSEEIFISKK